MGAQVPEVQQITVTVRYFSVLRERRGREEETVSVAPGTTVQDLYAGLFPAGPEGRLPVLYALDQSYARPDDVLTDGVEVAFIPPLGGG